MDYKIIQTVQQCYKQQLEKQMIDQFLKQCQLDLYLFQLIIIMFKKNPNRPPIVVALKKVPGGYKVGPNQSQSLFQVKRIIRTMYRPDLVAQGSNLGIQQNGLSIPSTIIQPPSHFTLPAFAGWFSLHSIHQIEREAFPQFFQDKNEKLPFSFGTMNSRLYKFYRNSMIIMWRQNVKKHLSAAFCRRNLMGDVSCIMRIHGFLQNWGLINFPSREHNKGILLKHPQRLTCYICEQSEVKKYYVTAVEDVLFQLCENCFGAKLYPKEIDQSEFKQVLQQNYKQSKYRELNGSQLIKLLDILSGTGISRERDKETWNIAQREFPQFTKQELLYNFMKIPQKYQMNANIFENNEDLHQQPPNQQSPTIFEDYLNPLQASIATAYCQLKQKGNNYDRINPIFKAAEQHAQYLCSEQEQKIIELAKMLIDVEFSKLQLKSLFIYEYQRLIQKFFLNQKTLIHNNLAQALKKNMIFLQKNDEPEAIEEKMEEKMQVQN